MPVVPSESDMTHTVSRANEEAPRSHSSFGAPAAASAPPRGRQAWCLVMVLMGPDFLFVMCRAPETPKGEQAQRRLPSLSTRDRTSTPKRLP
jgi:hypothetical protein